MDFVWYPSDKHKVNESVVAFNDLVSLSLGLAWKVALRNPKFLTNFFTFQPESQTKQSLGVSLQRIDTGTTNQPYKRFSVCQTLMHGA
jgi:hypothetical protein